MAPAPPPRRPLSRTALPTYLGAAKTTSYTDTALQHSSTTRSSITSAGSSSSSSSGSNIRSLSWSPLGSLIATGDARILRVWNADRPNVRYSTELKAPPASTNSSSQTSATTTSGRPPSAPMNQRILGTERVGWNPTREAELASVGTDGIVRFWDVKSRGGCIGEVKLGGEGLGLAWSPDGEDVLVARKDNTLIPISRRTLTQITDLADSQQSQNQIFAKQPHSTSLSTGAAPDSKPDKDKEKEKEKDRDQGHIYPPSFSFSGKELYLPTTHNLQILSYPNLSLLHTLSPQTASCTLAIPSPTGRHIATGGSDALLTLYSTQDLLCTATVPAIDGPVRCAAFSWEGAYIAAGSDECPGIVVAGVETGDILHEVKTAGHGVGALEWCPGRYALAWAETGPGGGGLKVLGLGG